MHPISAKRVQSSRDLKNPEFVLHIISSSFQKAKKKVHHHDPEKKNPRVFFDKHKHVMTQICITRLQTTAY